MRFFCASSYNILLCEKLRFEREKKMCHQHAHGCRRQGLGVGVDEFFFCHVIHHFELVFDKELIENDFKYLKDMLDTMVDVDFKDKEELIK